MIIVLWLMTSRLIHESCKGTILAKLVDNRKLRFDTFDDLNKNKITCYALKDIYVAQFLVSNL